MELALCDDSIIEIFKQLSPLELLRLSLASSRMKLLADKASKILKFFNVEYRGFLPLFNRPGTTHTVNGDGVDIKDEFLFTSKVIAHFKNIRVLKLKVKSTSKTSFAVMCQALNEHCHELRRVYLSGDRFNVRYEDIKLELLASHVPTLKHVSLGDGITEQDTERLIEDALNLSSIELLISSDRITGECFKKNASRLRHVTITGSVYWWELSPPIMKNLVTGLKECKESNLQALKFKCKGIRQETISLLGNELAMANMTTLSFDRPSFYQAEVRFVDLTPISTLKELTRLDLSVFTFVDDDDVVKILSSCSKLTRLCLRIPTSKFHSMVTDSSLSKLNRFLPLLQQLILQNVRANETTLESFAQLKHLKLLSLEDVSINSSNAIKHILNKSLKLQRFSLIQCFNTSKRQFSSLLDDLMEMVRSNKVIHHFRVEQDTIYEPPEVVNIPRRMKVTLKKFRDM